MINQNTKLQVYLNDTNFSNEAFDFTRDAFQITFTTSDYLYIGYSKPINSIYYQFNTSNLNQNTIAAEYYNGSSWVSLSNYYDDTKGFTRSGFMTWDRNQTSQSSNTINDIVSYWIRLKPNANQTQTTIQAINFVFADDQDLLFEVPEITDSNHLAGKASHILTHVAVKNQIIQELNNKDFKKNNISTGLKEDLNCWDILDVNQLKQAAIFLALSKIYFNFNDSADDKYSQKSNYYLNQYKSAIELSRLSLDSNGDGKADVTETQAEGFSIIRLKR